MYQLFHYFRYTALSLLLTCLPGLIHAQQTFPTYDADQSVATFDFSKFDPAIHAPGLTSFMGFSLRIAYVVIDGDNSINVMNPFGFGNEGVDNPFREVYFQEEIPRNPKSTSFSNPYLQNPKLYQKATTWRFTGTSSSLVGVSIDLGIDRPVIVFDHLVIQPSISYSKRFSFRTVGTADLTLNLIGSNLLQNNFLSFSYNRANSSYYYIIYGEKNPDNNIYYDIQEVRVNVPLPESLTLTLIGDSLTIFYPPNSIEGLSRIYNSFDGGNNAYSLIVNNEYLDVQGGFLNWKSITLNDNAVVTATKKGTNVLSGLMSEGTSGICSHDGITGTKVIIHDASLKAFPIQKHRCEDVCEDGIEDHMEPIRPVDADDRDVFRVIVPHQGLFTFTVSGTIAADNVAFNETYAFSAHHPDDDPNYYIYLPNGTYSITVGSETKSVDVNGEDQDLPGEGDPAPVTPPSGNANYIQDFPPSTTNFDINIRTKKATRLYLTGTTCELQSSPAIILPPYDSDYQIRFSDHVSPRLDGPGNTYFMLVDWNFHHMVFDNIYFNYFNIHRDNTQDALRHFEFVGSNTIWREPAAEHNAQFVLDFAGNKKVAGAVLYGDSLTAGGIDQPFAALTVGNYGAYHLELNLSYLTLWGGQAGGISSINGVHGIDSVFVDQGVVTSLGKTTGMFAVNNVFIEPTASLKSQSFDSTAAGSLSFLSDGALDHVGVQPKDSKGNSVYCVRIPHEGGKSVYIQAVNGPLRLQVYFTSHHPLYDPETGQPIPNSIDPYYYIFLPNGKYRFAIQNFNKYEANVNGSDVTATPFSLNFDDYTQVEFASNSSPSPLTMDIKLTPISGSQISKPKEPSLPTLTGGKPDNEGTGITTVKVNENNQNWNWDDDLAFHNTYLDRLYLSYMKKYFPSSGKRAIHFYGQNIIRPKIIEDDDPYWMGKTRTVNPGIGLDVGNLSTAALEGDSLTIYTLMTPKNSIFSSDATVFNYIHRGAITNNQAPTSVLELNMDYLFLRGTFAAIAANEDNSGVNGSYWGTIRADRGVITCLGDRLALLDVSKVVVSENASLKLASLDGSRTGSNSVHSQPLSHTSAAGVTLSDANRIQPVNADNQPVYCVSVPHHGTFALTVTAVGGTSRPLTFTAHHPAYDATGLPLEDADPDPYYYLWLPDGEYTFAVTLADRSTQLYTATVDGADLLADLGELIPPPVTPPTPPSPGPSPGPGGENPEPRASFRVTFRYGDEAVKQLTVQEGDSIPLQEAPADLLPPEEGLVLLYWFAGNDEDTPWNFDLDPVTAHIALSPKWGLSEPAPPPPPPVDALSPLPADDFSLLRAGDDLFLSAPGSQPILSVRLADLTGRILFSANNPASSPANNDVSLDLSPLPKGAYLLRIAAPAASKQFKFIR
jgi:hypothetical protein